MTERSFDRDFWEGLTSAVENLDPGRALDAGCANARRRSVQVSVDTATAALDPHRWELLVAEDRPRARAAPASTP